MAVDVPRSFGAKLWYMLWPLLITLVLAVGISLLVLWRWAIKLDERLVKEHDERVKVEKVIKDDLEADKQELVKTKEVIAGQGKQITALEEDKKRLAEDLARARESLASVSDLLKTTGDELKKFKVDQQEVDQKQRADIADNSRRITYVEREIKRLDTIEKDIVMLKDDTGTLKKDYTDLRRDLIEVRDRGAVTEVELNRLSERSRVFQLRVLAARAREAADAAREGDLKKLLARLSD